MTTSVALFLIKLVQILMLLAAAAALSYGVWHLGQWLRWQLTGKPVSGEVVEVETSTEKRQRFSSRIGQPFVAITLFRPVVEYSRPGDSAARYRVRATLTLEGELGERYAKGAAIAVHVDPGEPGSAYVMLPLAAYFWPLVAFVSGLAGVLLVGGLFFLHEGAFGRDISEGVSLLRSLHVRHAGVMLAGLVALLLILRQTAPWLGVHEAAAIVTGEWRLLPALLKAHGPPPPGAHLNASETAVARLPWLGPGYASTAIELAVAHGNRADIERYLAAYAASPERFPIRSDRLLWDTVHYRDLQTMESLLALGFDPPGDPVFDPLQYAIETDRPEFVAALRAARLGPKPNRR